ncbi:MAG: type II toxin-antitoxin system VapC family toxin [Thaumarchaeota archaeon]|nr:MAG: type II toxin-antitoxin system VapC family toxin [Nitrososphaerota archaeon]
MGSEYLEGSLLGEKVRERLADDGNEIFTHDVSLAEIISKVRRREKDTDAAWSAIMTNSKIFALSEKDSRDAGLLHAKVKSKHSSFGLADAFVLSAARKLGAKVLTGDPHFANIEDAVMLS